MGNYVLSCCSTSDLTEQHLKDRDIHYISFHFSIDGQKYSDDFGKTISYDEFYKKMVNGSVMKTSQVNIDEYEEYFIPFLEQGMDILHVTLSSGISGSYNSARIAAEDLSEKFPERKIYIVDSLGASSGYGLLMDKAADLRDAGMNIDQLRDWLVENRLRVHHWFFSTDLTFYIKGGRVSKTAGLFGTILKICPLLNMSDDGRLIPRKKVRGKAAVINEIVARMEENADNGLNYDGKCYMCHSDCLDDAEKVASLIEERFHNLNGKVEIYNIGTVIGSHTGPGTVAVFFWGKKRDC